MSRRSVSGPQSDSSADEKGPARFLAGDVVDGRYAIIRLIGTGGMGEVYEAEDRRSLRRVALKTVLPRLGRSETAIRRFVREIHLSRKIVHPNVMQIYDVFEITQMGGDRSVPCMVMELLDGETLADHLQEKGPLPLPEALSVALQMASGLAAAHRAGVVHRDLKPDNVFLVTGEDGLRAVLTDFGVARPTIPVKEQKLDSLTATNVIVGTPTYMAPEQLELEEATAASDIYTLGLVIYEMLTGTLPFEAEAPLQMVFKRVTDDPEPLRTHLPDVDSHLEATILRCLEREPGERFANAREVVKALRGGEASGTDPDDAMPRWIWIAGAVLTAAAILLLLLVG